MNDQRQAPKPEGEGPASSSFLCVKYSGDDARQRKHAATWVGYRIVTRDASKLQSTCVHCGKPIRRAHLRSAQWRAVDK